LVSWKACSRNKQYFNLGLKINPTYPQLTLTLYGFCRNNFFFYQQGFYNLIDRGTYQTLTNEIDHIILKDDIQLLMDLQTTAVLILFNLFKLKGPFDGQSK
jgi:hypothetical protein